MSSSYELHVGASPGTLPTTVAYIPPSGSLWTLESEEMLAPGGGGERL